MINKRKIISIFIQISLVAPLFVLPTNEANADATVIFLTNTALTEWTVPSDWNSSSNTIEVIGGGGGGNSAHFDGGGGGGGGAYAKITNASLTANATVGIKVGVGGSSGGDGGDTYVCNSTSNCASIAGSAVQVGAKGGAGGNNGRTGGSAGSSIGTVKYAGGNGGAPYDHGSGEGGSGGGGAGGPHGTGANGGTCAGGDRDLGGGGGGGAGGGTNGQNCNAGAEGGDNWSGVGGGAIATAGTDGGGGGGGSIGSMGGGAGGAGTDWDATHGSGGGGGGQSENDGNGGGDGGLYGGGGGGLGAEGSSNTGEGAQGIIVISYTPSSRSSLSRPANNLGLIAYFPLNEGTSTIATDMSGSGRIGTFSSSPVWTNGKNGKALSFDGTDDYVLLSNGGITIPSGGAITVSAWVKTSDDFGVPISLRDTNDAPLVEFAIGHNGATTNAGHFLPLTRYDSNTGLENVTASARVDDGQWHHLAVVLDQSANTLTAYVDGTSYSVPQNADGSITVTDKMSIGAEKVWIDTATGSVDQRYLEGVIDEVRIYSRALAATEIRGLSQSKANIVGGAEKLKVTGGLVGHWTFNGNDLTWSSETAGTAYDRSGGGNHGTLTNMSQLVSPAQGKLGQAFWLNGIDDYIIINNESNFDFDTTSPYSIAAWVKREKISGSDTVFAKVNNGGNFHGIQLDLPGANLNLRLIITGNNASQITAATAETSIPIGVWKHVAVTYDGSGTGAGVQLYIDGVAATSGGGTLTGSPLNDATPAIGNNIPSGGSNFQGVMDDVRVYNRVITGSEVKQLYQMGLGTVIKR